jgi:serine/threonine protein kinase
MHRETQENRAIKIVLKSDIEQSGPDRMRLLHQIEMLTSFDHPNVGQVIEIFEDDRRLYFVCELMYGGSLLESIIRQDTLSEYDSASICR